ncbi:ABC transporter permease subunit [Escherichia coli]
MACRSLGLSPRRIKLTAFTISAAFAGFAGTLFAARQGFVSPDPSPLLNQPLYWR